MKHLLAITLLALVISNTAWAAEKTVVLKVDKMTCALCPITVSKAIKGVEGVESVDIDYDAKTATVTFDDKATDVDTVAASSTNAGYPATPQ